LPKYCLMLFRLNRTFCTKRFAHIPSTMTCGSSLTVLKCAPRVASMRSRVLTSLTLLLMIALCSSFIMGCANQVYPVTTGFHALSSPADKDKKRRLVVWATHPAIATTVMSLAQQTGHTVLERSRLDQIFKEQAIRLTHTSDDDAQILRVGKLIGADHIIFAEHTVSSSIASSTYVNRYGGGSRSDTVYHVSVAVRSVNLESGEVRWSGTAQYPGPITNPEAGLSHLTQSAISRATCPTELGWTWTEARGSNQDGCRKRE
jgi:hypothetical protein